MATTNIINKGIHCKVRIHGSGLSAGTNYTAVLYYSASKAEYRATTTATATDTTTDSETITSCVFDFTPEQTEQLKAGNVMLEVYDTNTLQQMVYNDTFATVRSTSLSK